MRVIKFRGYNTKYKKWYYGYLDKPKKNGDWFTIHDENYLGNMLVEEDSIGQYTGFQDKNGKEIYEGDIIKFDNQMRKVAMRAGCWIVINDYTYDYELANVVHTEDVEVVDNIYERNKDAVKIGF